MKRFTESDHHILSLFQDYTAAWMHATFDTLTPPQREAWPIIAEKKNTLIFSPTGSGKTLAAFLFCIDELFKRSTANVLQDTVYILYVSPLRALSNDIHRNLYQPLRGISRILRQRGIDHQPIRARVRTGDTTPKERAQMAKNPPHILITTPETLYILLTTKKFRENLKTVQYVIVDEIHALAGSKRGVQLSLSLERLVSLAGHDMVRIGLSATQSPVEEIAAFLVGMRDENTPRACEIVTIGARKHLDLQVISPVDDLLEAKNEVVWNAAYAALIEMIRAHETTLIFTNSRYRTEHMALNLKEMGEEQGLSIGSHHGSMSRMIRQDLEKNLKQNRLNAVVATSSLELGIDIGNIDLVCNVGSPKSLSSGMQRIGRAGHLLKETSKGRVIATDPDDLAESAVLVKGIAEGNIDTTRIQHNALDILAQQVVACAAADEWNTEDLYRMVRRSYCYHTLTREDFYSVVEMLSSQVTRKVFPKLFYDKVNQNIKGTRGSRTIAFRCGGAIPDVSNYDVYQEHSKVGTLDEGFVERIRLGDVFILGSQAWQMRGLDKKKVMVHQVTGIPPTIPYWGGVRISRTFDLGLLVGKFRREVEERIQSEGVEEWLQHTYFLDRDGASAVAKYYREQAMMVDVLPTDRRIVVECFRNELGQQQIAVHSCFGVRVNDIWGFALLVAAREKYNMQVSVATVDDGILLTLPENTVPPEDLFHAVDTPFLRERWASIVMESPVFALRFRHCAVRSFLVLREYAGKRVPVWLQSLKAAELLEECKNSPFPLVKEALRESAEDAFDLPGLLQVLKNIEEREIEVVFIQTRIPSPFIHQLLLVGQFGDFGRISNEERKVRLIHLHRQVLKQLIDEDLIKSLLVEEEVHRLEKEMQFLLDRGKARSRDELARILQTLGDLTQSEVEERVKDEEMALAFLEELCSEKRILQVNIPFAVPEERWIPTELFKVYRAAFTRKAKTETHSFERVGIIQNGEIQHLPVAWVPPELRGDTDHGEALTSIVKTFLEHHGPITKYEVMERYGITSEVVTSLLDVMDKDGLISSGSFVGTKDSPQWCWKQNLEELHRRSLKSLSEKVKPLSPARFADFMLKWQHLHPRTQLEGKEGVYAAVRQLQTWEEHIVCWEKYLLGSRVSDYSPRYLDELIKERKVSFGRFNRLPPHELYILPNRGAIQLYCREEYPLVKGEVQRDYFEDVKPECEEIIDVLTIWPSLSYEGIVTGTRLEKHRVGRALFQLFQLGVIENDSYDTVRESTVVSGMSAAWDLTHVPGEIGDEEIFRNMRRRGIRIERGKWTLLPEKNEAHLLDRVRQLFRRYGIVTRDVIRMNREAINQQEFNDAVRILILRGEVREGRFIEGLEGIQYATPEAVEVLRGEETDGAFVVVNMRDPANVYGKPFPITNEAGEVVRHSVAMANGVVVQGGIPVAVVTTRPSPGRFINVEVSILYDLSREEVVALMREVITYGKRGGVQKRFKVIRVLSFNGNAVEGSGVEKILEAFGFTRKRNGFMQVIREELKAVNAERVDAPPVFRRVESAGRDVEVLLEEST